MKSVEVNVYQFDELSDEGAADEDEIENTKDLYAKYGSEYPYACDAVAYYIFGDDSDYNILIRAFKGVFKGCDICPSITSEFMLGYEYSWEENIATINDFIKNMPTTNGSLLSDYF